MISQQTCVTFIIFTISNLSPSQTTSSETHARASDKRLPTMEATHHPNHRQTHPAISKETKRTGGQIYSRLHSCGKEEV